MYCALLELIFRQLVHQILIHVLPVHQDTTVIIQVQQLQSDVQEEIYV